MQTYIVEKMCIFFIAQQTHFYLRIEIKRKELCAAASFSWLLLSSKTNALLTYFVKENFQMHIFR